MPLNPQRTISKLKALRERTGSDDRTQRDSKSYWTRSFNGIRSIAISFFGAFGLLAFYRGEMSSPFYRRDLLFGAFLAVLGLAVGLIGKQRDETKHLASIGIVLAGVITLLYAYTFYAYR